MALLKPDAGLSPGFDLSSISVALRELVEVLGDIRDLLQEHFELEEADTLEEEGTEDSGMVKRRRVIRDDEDL